MKIATLVFLSLFLTRFAFAQGDKPIIPTNTVTPMPSPVPLPKGWPTPHELKPPSVKLPQYEATVTPTPTQTKGKK